MGVTYTQGTEIAKINSLSVVGTPARVVATRQDSAPTLTLATSRLLVRVDNPAENLLRHLPSTWDETRVLPGSEIGTTAAFARRRGQEWYVGLLNGEDPLALSVELSFLGEGQWNAEIFCDNADPASFKRQSKAVTSKDTLTIETSARGGAVIWIRRTAP